MPSLHTRVSVNPTAGAWATRRRWPEIESLLRGGDLSFDFQYTEGRGHAELLARTAALDGCRFLVAVGGDGTINEAVNGILSSGCAEAITLGIIGTGTGNDLIRSLEVPRDYRAACRCLLTGYQRHETSFEEWGTCIDVGLVEYTSGGVRHTRYFVNGAGVGFDAEVADAAKKVPWRIGNTIPFVIGLIRMLPAYRNKQMRVAVDGRIEERRVLSVVISNGAYFGGGMKIAPDASITDRKLDVVIIGDVGKLELLRVFPRVYKGTHVTHPKVMIERAEEISITSKERILLQADGEILGEGPVSFRILPQVLRLAL